MKRTIGIDAHRDFLQVTIRSEGRVLERCRVATERSALARFAATLGEGDLAIIESTSFAWPIAQQLLASGCQVTISNPVKTKAIAAAKVKTDRVDADTLAMLGEADLIAPVWLPDADTLALRRQVAAREKLVRHRVSFRRQVSAILTRNTIRPPMSDAFGKGGRQWLASLQLDMSDRMMLDSLLAMHDVTQQQIDTFDKLLAAQALDRPQAQLLLTIPGMGVTAALALVATIGTIDRFATPRKLVGYLGLDPRVRQSGVGPMRTGSISKQGAVYTRAMLVEAATAAVRTPGPLRAFYQHLRAKNGHQIAVCAVARKLVVICWHMLRNGEAYRYALPSLTERKLHNLERRARRPHAHRDRYQDRRRHERALLEQAERQWQAQQKKRARASHRERDTSAAKAASTARQPSRSQATALP